MESLRLAIELLDRVEAAQRDDEVIHLTAEARRLVRHHPESDASEKDIAEVLCEEIAAARLR